MTYNINITSPLKFRPQVLLIREKENLISAQSAQRFGVGIASGKKTHLAITRNKPATKINMNELLQDVKNYPMFVYVNESNV